MKLTDPAAIKALKKVNICELSDMIADYPESDVNGRTDWEMIGNEAGWLLDLFNSDENSHSDDLRDAREFIRNYPKGTAFKPYPSYTLQTAINTVNEYNRLVRFVKKLKVIGIHCPYC